MKRGIVGPFKTIQIPSSEVFEDVSGQKFGMLLVRGFIGRSTTNFPLWLCDCDCGNFTVGRANNLKRGTQSNCGCVLREKNRLLNTKHGQGSPKFRTKEYKTWLSMRERCFNPRHSGFRLYGGRGISICDRWANGENGRSGFECFFQDMGERPSPQHSIDRIDNDGSYNPDNCRWADKKSQARNRTTVRKILVDGISRSLPEVCDELGLDLRIVRNRLLQGESIPHALRPISNRRVA